MQTYTLAIGCLCCRSKTRQKDNNNGNCTKAYMREGSIYDYYTTIYDMDMDGFFIFISVGYVCLYTLYRASEHHEGMTEGKIK